MQCIEFHALAFAHRFTFSACARTEVDTIFLNNTSGDNYNGELRGHLNDTIEVVYDLTVTDEGEEVEAEWNLRE